MNSTVKIVRLVAVVVASSAIGIGLGSLPETIRAAAAQPPKAKSGHAGKHNFRHRYHGLSIESPGGGALIVKGSFQVGDASDEAEELSHRIQIADPVSGEVFFDEEIGRHEVAPGKSGLSIPINARYNLVPGRYKVHVGTYVIGQVMVADGGRTFPMETSFLDGEFDVK